MVFNDTRRELCASILFVCCLKNHFILSFSFFMIAKVWNSFVSIGFCVRVFVFDELFDLSGWYNCVDQITCNKTIDLNVYTSLAFIIRVEPEFCMRGKWCSECRIFTNGNERKSRLIFNDKNGCEMVPMDLHWGRQFQCVCVYIIFRM